jgi:uncharacterized membrane protein
MEPQQAQANRQRRRQTSSIVLAILFFAVYWPGGAFLQQIQASVFGWPLFVLWAVIIAPALILLVFGYNAYKNIMEDRQMMEREDRQPSETRGDV